MPLSARITIAAATTGACLAFATGMLVRLSAVALPPHFV